MRGICFFWGDICCGFGEVVRVDGLWFWEVVGIVMCVFLGKCAILVVDDAIATPASLNTFLSEDKDVCFFGRGICCGFGEVVGVDRL